VVDARHVARAGWRWVLGVEGERVNVDEAIWDVAVVLVGLDETEPGARLVGEARLVIEVESSRDDGVTVVNARVVVPVVAALVALATDGPDELKNGVVEVELHANLGVGGLHVEGLVLDDEDFVVGGGEAITLSVVKVDVCGLEASREIVWREAASSGAVLDGDVGARDDDAALEALELDVDLDTVELERGEGESLARVLGEPEGEGHVEHSLLARVADELSAGVALANHLSETAARLASELLPHEEEVVVEGVDGGATDHDASTADEELANVVGPVSPHTAKFGAEVVGAILDLVAALEGGTLTVFVAEPLVLSLLELDLLLARGGIGEAVVDVVGDGSLVVLGAGGARLVHENWELVASSEADAVLLDDIAGGDAWKVDDDIHVVNQVTISVESNLGLSAESNCGVERLANGLHSKRSVFIVAHLPESEGRVLRQISVKCTLCDKLGEGS